MRPRHLPPLAILVSAVLAAACGDDASGDPTSGGSGGQSQGQGGAAATTASTGAGGEGGGYVPADDELAFESPTYSIEAGEEINYWCYTFRLPDERTTVREIEVLHGGATHHLAVFQTLVEEPEGAFACPELVRDTWLPIYATATSSGRLTLPEGAGFQFVPGQQVLAQLHLLNATPDTVTDSATVVFRTSEEEDVLRAGMFGFDQRNIEIPPNASDVEHGISCTAGREMDVFAVFGHMHQRGTRIELSRGENPGDEVLYEAEWAFEEQPTEPVTFHVAADDRVHLRCTYDNTTDQTLLYGESSFDEMCSLVMYYTPFEELAGCVEY